MAKKRERSSDEYYRGIIRELKAELKRALKANRQLEKTRYLGSKDSNEEDETVEHWIESTCSNCGKGVIEEKDLGVRILETCNICEYKKVRKKNG